MKTPLLICLFALFPGLAQSWGPTGHRIVGAIADQALNSSTKQKIKEIMGHESLAMASTWADEVRSDPLWAEKSQTWHYVSIPTNKEYKDIKKNPKGDIIEAIERFSAELKNKELSQERKKIAIRWLVHLIGDLHQPLHVGLSADRGGNTISLRWFSESTNLHAIWDSKMIELQKLSFSEWVSFINHPSQRDIKKWQSSTVLDWAKESMSYRPQVYAYPKGKKYNKYWAYDYTYKNLPLVRLRLLQAGYRLAEQLNKSF